MKFITALFLIISIFPSTYANKSSTPASEWKSTGLTTNVFTSLLSEECMYSQKSFLGCFSAINTPLIYKKKSIRFYPNTILKDPRYNVFKVIETGMFFSWVQVQLTTKSKTKNEKKAQEENIYKSVFKIYEYFQQNELTTNKIFPKLYKQSLKYSELESINHPENALIASLSFNTYYYFAVDPHASISLINPFDGKDSYTGIGIQYFKNNDKFVITKIIKDSPAMKSGLLTGDLIIGVNDNSTEHLSVEDVSDLISGKENTDVILTLLRDSQTIKKIVTRQNIEIQNINYSMTNNFIHLKINNFMDDSLCKEVEELLTKFEDKNIKGLILDLRDNPGGLVNQAVCLTSLFVGTKKTILTERSVENRTEIKMQENENHKLFQFPLITLINNGSASASEILSGALQDYKRAWIVGERSFGKGTIQSNFYFNDENKISYWKTTGRFYLPSGRTNQILGIIPDFEISKLTKEELDELPREEDLFYGTITDTENVQWKQSSEREIEMNKINFCIKNKQPILHNDDVQLQMAIQILECTAR